MSERESKPTTPGRYWLVPPMCALVCVYYAARDDSVVCLSEPPKCHWTIRPTRFRTWTWSIVHEGSRTVFTNPEIVASQWQVHFIWEEKRGEDKTRDYEKGETSQTDRYADRHSELSFLVSTAKTKLQLECQHRTTFCPYSNLPLTFNGLKSQAAVLDLKPREH